MISGKKTNRKSFRISWFIHWKIIQFSCHLIEYNQSLTKKNEGQSFWQQLWQRNLVFFWETKSRNIHIQVINSYWRLSTSHSSVEIATFWITMMKIPKNNKNPTQSKESSKYSIKHNDLRTFIIIRLWSINFDFSSSYFETSSNIPKLFVY